MKAKKLLLKTLVSPSRQRRIKEVLDRRTDFATVLLENISQPHNASAILRTCDGLGIQFVHTIESRAKFSPSKGVSLGSEKWLTIERYTSSKEAAEALKTKGYRIYVTSSHKDAKFVDEIPLEKSAFVFGTELEGVSSELEELADGFVKIPMYGFAESYNVSVAAAIVLSHFIFRARREAPEKLPLDENTKEALEIDWLAKSVKKGKRILEVWERFEKYTKG